MDLQTHTKSDTSVKIANVCFDIESVRNSHIKGAFKYYTGFSYAAFIDLYQFLNPIDPLEPFKYEKKMSGIKHLALKDQFFMTIIKLRLNLGFTNLGHLFGISQQNAAQLFSDWISYMFYTLGSISIWPSRDIIYGKMPQDFRERFPSVFAILDCTELKIEKPSALSAQSQCYSDYKSSTTLKGLLAIDPRGSVIFAGTLFTGAISDKEITRQCGLLTVLQQLLECEKLKPGDGIMVDKGFRIQEDLEELGLRLIIPPFASSTAQMSAAAVSSTRVIAMHRVHVERAIARIKNFKILSQKFELSHFKSINQIWFVCCVLTNFMPHLIK